MQKVIEKIKNDEILRLIKCHAESYMQKNANVYLVGGLIRDFYLGHENFDKDVVVENIDAKAFSQSLAQKMNATFIPLDEENKIYRLILQDKKNCIDIANLIGKNIEEDLNRRDLTINAIAVNLQNFEILDLVNGISDLKTREIRGVCAKNFIDDPLRLLRIFRFQGQLNFKISKELNKITFKHKNKIHKVAKERINYELLKLFSGKYTDAAINSMDETSLLEEILPIITDLKKVPPNSHHHLDLFSHSIEVIRQVQKNYDESCEEVKKHLETNDFGPVNRLAHLKLAAFLHDIGKFNTWTIEEETGKHRFIKHDDVGSKMAAKFLKEMKFSKKQISYIEKMIKYHIYPSHVVSSPEKNDKIYMRFIRKMQEEVIDIIILAKSDRLSARGVEITDEIVNNNINELNSLLEFYLNVKDELKPLPKLISGEEIMKLLNIPPSKELGEIIKSLQEAQVSGEICTKSQAIKFIKSRKNI